MRNIPRASGETGLAVCSTEVWLPVLGDNSKRRDEEVSASEVQAAACSGVCEVEAVAAGQVEAAASSSSGGGDT